MQENRCGNKLGQKWVGRLISVFLVLTMLLGIMPVSVFAAQDSDTLSDIPEISTIENQQSGSLSDFYNVEDITTLSDDETASTTPKIVDGAYQIGTAAELTWFASAVNDGTATTQDAVLTTDIDLGNQEWTPIGNDDNPYEGSFDGANHTVHNLSITKGAMYTALFGYQDSGEIKNLTVDGTIAINGYSVTDEDESFVYAAGIVGWACGNVLNCTNNVNITLTGVELESGAATVGGICGTLGTRKKGSVVVGCVNNGNISCEVNPNSSQYGTVDVAGIVGSQFALSKIEASHNSGSVNAHLTGFGKARYGGISNVVGATSVNVNSCYNTGVITGSVKSGIGSYTLSGGALIGGFGGTVYPTNCAYLSGTYTGTGMSNMSGQSIADAISGISAKTEDELKSTDFLSALNAATPITDYTVTWVTGADGYPTIGNGCIQALNAETLQSLWISEKVSGQMISPITYHNGYIYTGTWNSETETGTYFALPVTDQNTSSTNETQDVLWRVTHKGGFYWAGAYATDKYVVFGSDDGSGETSSSASAVLYSVDPLTGRTISTLTGIVGDIRSTIAYDNGYVYFTTKGGYFYKAAVSNDGTLSNLTSSKMAYMATGTPVVYGGVAFVTCGGADQFNSTGTVYAVNIATMEEIGKATTPAYVQASMLLSTAYESSGKLYLYAANNGVTGTISVITYDKVNRSLTCADLYTPTPANSSDPNEYCLCAPICDANGTIYFKNDSGRLFAIRSKAAEAGHAITVLTTENGTVTTDKQRATAGETVTVTITPALGYQLKSLKMNDQPLTVTNGKATFIMPDAIAVLDAEFEKSSSAVDELRQAMLDLTITDASKATYDAIEAIKAARNNLTAAEKAEIEDDYKAFLQKAEAFNNYLDEAKTAAIKEINDYVNSLDKSKYSEKNWTKIKDLQSTAIRNINKAPYTEEIDRIVANALDEIKAVKAGEITVTFRLVGALEATQDVNLTTDSYLPEYVTWIPTTTYSLDAGATVYDVFMEALKDAGISQVGADSNYVRTIYAPTCLGGYALSEFTNGKRSGWMYTVNGSHPNQGLKKWELHDKDVVVWHYVNDYAHEVADWFNDPQYPALGDGTYYNGWLRAADITPERYVEQLLGKILTVGEHGKAEPKLTFQHIGKSVTFTFTPDKGYKVKDVKVNGKSVGAVTTYTIDKLTVSTRIEVEFTDGKLPFTDVHENDWFYDDVAFAYNEGLFAGTSNTTFSPNASMTRAMLVTVLYRLEGKPAVSGRSGFSDVQIGSYYEDAVTWAANNGIVNGTSTSTFSPNTNVTREQMAAILYRYAQYKKYDTAASSSLTSFSDYATVSGYAVTPMQWAVAEKLINGNAGKLMPTGNATRAQVAAILHRFVENVATTK